MKDSMGFDERVAYRKEAPGEKIFFYAVRGLTFARVRDLSSEEVESEKVFDVFAKKKKAKEEEEEGEPLVHSMPRCSKEI